MTKYDNRNRGAIWPNRKKRSDKSPDFTGTLDVDGVPYQLNAWKKTDEDNAQAPSLRFSIMLKEDKGNGQAPSNNAPSDDFDDDIPF